MAKIELATPFDEMSGKLSSNERIVMRTRYGRTHTYAIRHPFRGPFSENQQTVINAFAQAVQQCKAEMTDPERLAYWQNRYEQYTKAARRNPARANARFIGTPASSSTSPDARSSASAHASSSASPDVRSSDKFYLTLRGFIIASLSAQLRSANQNPPSFVQ